MNLIFDFDGTICDSIKVSVDTVNPLLKTTGFKETSVSEVKKIGLKGIIVSRNIPQNILDKIISEYRTLSKENYETATMIKNLDTVLDKLSKKHNLGILTTNKPQNVNKFLNRYNIDYFKFVRSEKNVFDKDKGLKKIIKRFKYKPEEIFFIGDETRDVEAAKSAGVHSISLTWGAESKKLLQKSKPDYIVSKPEELLKLF